MQTENYIRVKKFAIPMNIAELGEIELIKKISKGIKLFSKDIIKGIGDDTAVLNFDKKHYLLLTTDTLVEVKNKIDGIEAFNARTLPGNNKRANKAADKYNIAKTGGSDAHFKFEVGTAYTLFEDSLRKALKNKKTKVNGTILYGPFGGLLSFLRKRI